MRHKFLIFVPSVMAMMAACSSDDAEVVTSDGTYVAPVYDYDYATDAALLDTGVYDPALFYAVIAQVYPGDAAIDVEIPDGGVVSTSRKFPRPLAGLLSRWGVQVTAACAPTTAFDDVDQDGIPASYTATFNCANQVNGSRTTNLTGAITIADTDDNSAVAGATITFNNLAASVAISGGDSRSRTLNGTITMAPSGTAFQINRDTTVAFDFSDSSGKKAQGTHVMVAQATYTPDNAADVFAAGTFNLTGQGTLTRNFQGANQSRVVTRTTNPALHWNRACRSQNVAAAGFDAGTLIYSDDRGGKLQATWNGCGSPSISTTDG